MLRDGPLRHRDFRMLFAGQTVSAFGDQLFPVAVAAKVVDAGGGEGELGAVLAPRVAALVLFVVLGGIWADRLPRTKVMISADVLRMVAVLGLAVTPGRVPLWVLAALTFLVGGGEAFFRPAYGAIVPSVVPRSDLGAANALTSVSLRTAAIAGPATAGVVVGLAGGARAAFFVDAATFAVSMLTLLRIREPAMAPRGGDRPNALREALEGLRAVRERPWIGAVLVMAALQLMLVVAPEMVVLPIVARDHYGGTEAYGWVLAVMSVGGVAGALAAGRWRPRRQGLVSLLGLLPYTLLPLALVAPWRLPVVLVAAVFAGLSLEPFIVYWSSALQREVPRALLARVISLDWLCSFALMPLGLALTGPAVAAFGRETVLLASCAVMVVTTLATLAVPGVMEFSTGDPRTGGDSDEPEDVPLPLPAPDLAP